MKKILIAEDNENNFLLFCQLFKNRDIEILRAKNGVEAVDICEKCPDICLVLMDINMPVMNGEDAAILIKGANPNIIIISQTAYDAYGNVGISNRKHFNDFITKPFSIIKLKNLVSKYCFGEK